VRRTPALLACACTVAAFLTPAPADAAQAERQAIEAVNHVRHAHGLPALRVAKSLNRSSGGYARRMLRRDYFGHAPRIRVASGFRSAGETLAWHAGRHPRPRRTVRRWMASPGHRAILLSRSFRWIGVGLARGRLGSRTVTAWVAHVGAR
jgi:uncharacterized protein YkwD